jgi:hypothetical protein
VKGPRMQNLNKEPGHKTAAVSENQDNTIWVWQEGFQTRVHEASKRNVQRAAEGEKLDLVEGPAPSETVEQPTRTISIRRAGDVGTPATWDSFVLTIGKEKLCMLVMQLDWLEPHKRVARNEQP